MILTSTGMPYTREQPIADADAKTFRAYKKILMKHGYIEELWCQACEESGDHAGCRAGVTDTSIEITCRHRRVFYQGRTY